MENSISTDIEHEPVKAVLRLAPIAILVSRHMPNMLGAKFFGGGMR